MRAAHVPTTDQERHRSRAPGDRPELRHRVGTRKTAGSGRPSAAPSWKDPAAQCVAGTESLFGADINGLLQQNLSNPVRVIDAFVDALNVAELGFEGVKPA